MLALIQVLLKAIALSELYVEEYFHFVSNFILLSFMFSEITTMYNVYLTTTVPFTEKKDKLQLKELYL